MRQLPPPLRSRKMAKRGKGTLPAEMLARSIIKACRFSAIIRDNAEMLGIEQHSHDLLLDLQNAKTERARELVASAFLERFRGAVHLVMTMGLGGVVFTRGWATFSVELVQSINPTALMVLSILIFMTRNGGNS